MMCALEHYLSLLIVSKNKPNGVYFHQGIIIHIIRTISVSSTNVTTYQCDDLCNTLTITRLLATENKFYIMPRR
jgi:hypothetical protein